MCGPAAPPDTLAPPVISFVACVELCCTDILCPTFSSLTGLRGMKIGPAETSWVSIDRFPRKNE